MVRVSKSITIKRPPEAVYEFWRNDDQERPVSRPSLHAHAPRAHRERRDRPDDGDQHRLPLSDAAKGYEIFLNKEDRCEKVVLSPR